MKPLRKLTLCEERGLSKRGQLVYKENNLVGFEALTCTLFFFILTFVKLLCKDLNQVGFREIGEEDHQ